MTVPLDRFTQRWEFLKGHAHVVSNADHAASVVLDILTQSEVSRVVLGKLDDAVEAAIRARAAERDIEVLKTPFEGESLPAAVDQAQAGVAGADFGIAQSGTLVEIATNDADRLVSALPRTYIGVISKRNLIENLEDAAPRIREIFQQNGRNCVVSFISGPSRTGDIEMILTLGVHGPEIAHVVILDD